MIKDKFNKLFFPYDDKPERFKCLDGLRGIAVLLVLLSHSSKYNVLFHETINFRGIGKIGVYLFFVLSAYLLDRQIALVYISGKSSKAYWKNYFLRRFLRIYPMLIIALVIHGFFTMIGIRTVIDKLVDIPAHMLLLKGENVFWSIPVEFKYYFISPVFMWFCHKYLKWDKMKMLIIFLTLIVISIVTGLLFDLPKISTLRYLPIFLVGTFISIYELIIKRELLLNIKSTFFNRIGVIAFVLVLVTVPYYFEILFGFKINIQSAAFHLPYAMLWGAVLLSAKYGTGVIKKLLELKFLRFIGSISFSMYLLHMPLLRFVRQLDLPSFMQIYVFLFITIIFSCISFLLIERPLSKIRIYSNTISEKELKQNTKS